MPEVTQETTEDVATAGGPVYCRHCGAEWVQGSQQIPLPSDPTIMTTQATLEPNWLCPACDRYQDSMICPTCNSQVAISIMPEEMQPAVHRPVKSNKE